MKSSTHIMIRITMTATFLTVNSFYSSSSGKENELDKRVRGDHSIVTPGAGAEGVELGEDIDAVMLRFGRDGFRMSRPPGLRELFKDVFDVDGVVKLFFDRIYYSDDNKIAFCVLRDRVEAVIGLSGDRITIHGIELEKGVSNFIFNYGNRDLLLIRVGTNGIYLYRNLGIAVMDDGMNDSIDLYIVFRPPTN
ncbi:MAG: hypothetical protein E4G96_03605, partial [Chrysiogenales bacterium]